MYFLANSCVQKEIALEIRKYFPLNDSKTMAFQNLQATAKTVSRGKMPASVASIRNFLKKLKIRDLCFHLKKLEKDCKMKQ